MDGTKGQDADAAIHGNLNIVYEAAGRTDAPGQYLQTILLETHAPAQRPCGEKEQRQRRLTTNERANAPTLRKTRTHA